MFVKREGIKSSISFDFKSKNFYHNFMNNSKRQNKLMLWLSNMNAKYKRFFEIIRFLIVGGIATIIDYFVMSLVLYAFDPSLYPNFFNVFYGGGNPSTIATVVGTGTGFCVSLIFNYLLSVFFVYEEKGNSKTAKGAVLFALLSIGGLLLNTAGMWLGYDIIGINEWIVKIIMTLIVLVYNYGTRKFFIFKKAKSMQTENSPTQNENQPKISETDSVEK